MCESEREDLEEMEWSGDNEEMKRRKALRTLGLKDDGEEMPKMKEVESAWRKKAKELHPDVQKRTSGRGHAGDADEEATARFRAAREAFELLRGDIKGNTNYLRAGAMGMRGFGHPAQSSSASASATDGAWQWRSRTSERNPFSEHGMSEAEKRRRKARRERWRDENVMKERDAARGNAERFHRLKERAIFARAIRVAEVLSKKGMTSPYLLLVDLGAVAGIVGTSCMMFGQL